MCIVCNDSNDKLFRETIIFSTVLKQKIFLPYLLERNRRKMVDVIGFRIFPRTIVRGTSLLTLALSTIYSFFLWNTCYCIISKLSFVLAVHALFNKHQKIDTFQMLIRKRHVVVHRLYCLKNVQIRSFFCSVFSCIRTRKNSVFGHFHAAIYFLKGIQKRNRKIISINFLGKYKVVYMYSIPGSFRKAD